MNGSEEVTIGGVVTFFWDSEEEDGHLLVNIDPDDHHKPDTFELTGKLRHQAISAIEEGSRIEFDCRSEHHEIVDPDGATIGASRLRVIAVRF